MSVCSLRDYQEEALKKLRSGCVLNGGLGSGKSRTGLAFYYTQYGGQCNTEKYVPMKNPRDLYIITTAKKRDAMEWDAELAVFRLSTDPSVNPYKNKIIVDSWQNIKKYRHTDNAFFIFDEQRVVGYGVWVQSFLEIARHNKWILLTATPGDTWLDYLPLFIANGFYRNKTQFLQEHAVWSPYKKFQSPNQWKWLNEGKLIRYRNSILVQMDFERQTVAHHETIIVNYDEEAYKLVNNRRWNIYKSAPIQNASEFCFVLHKIVNSSIDRQDKILDLVAKHRKVIIFYNYDYELEILHKLFDGYYPITEWNGHKHQELPTGDHWVYLVQYISGSEAWNCVTTDTIIFYSQSYSYKLMTQAAGRIDRLNTPYKDLYYYHFRSTSKIDNAIYKALAKKKNFSEKGFAPKFENSDSENKKPADDKYKSYQSKNFSGSKIISMDAKPQFTAHISDYVDEWNSWEHPIGKIREGD